VINESQKEMQLVMFSLYQSVQYDKIPDYSQRRIIFANDLIDVMTSLYQTFENVSPELLLNMRNEIIEDTILDLLKDNNEIMILQRKPKMTNKIIARNEQDLFKEGSSVDHFKFTFFKKLL